ncbi:hypothetical protein [Neobacillus mesonae]|uniref:hypothetical protein n=1 Tax=Neobacillus mesonae TaxID=1193713 RepID=UPI0013DE997E|nr:hypothetical protein [Neobacillus mesonae]
MSFMKGMKTILKVFGEENVLHKAEEGHFEGCRRGRLIVVNHTFKEIISPIKGNTEKLKSHSVKVQEWLFTMITILTW